jgi:hypothetical protein
MENKQYRAEPRGKRILSKSDFVLLWILLTVCSMVVGFEISKLIISIDVFFFSSLDRNQSELIAYGLSVIIFMEGFLFTITQWLLLRKEVDWADHWALATLSGSLLGLGIIANAVNLTGELYVTLLGDTITKPILGLLIGTVIGSCYGIVQWLVLRKQVEHARHWLGISIISWALGSAIGLTILNGLIVGIATGLGLARVLYTSSSDESHGHQA